MNRNRLLLGLGGALVVAFLASSYVYRQLQKVRPGGSREPAKLTHVVIAAALLQMGHPLSAADLTLMDWPEAEQPPGSFSRVDDCVGRALVVPLVQGELILDPALAKRDGGAGLSVAIPPGMRAVSVGVDDVIAVAGFVTPGTIVDVLATGIGPQGPVTRTLLEHVPVLAVGQQLQTDAGKPQTAPVVTLLVSPGDGERLTLAAAEDKVHLALRNTNDIADASPAPVDAFRLFSPAPAANLHAVPAKPVRARLPYTVQVIRGDKVELLSFPQ